MRFGARRGSQVFSADKNTQRVGPLHRLLQLVKRARTVQSIENSCRLGTAIQQAGHGQLDESGIAIFTLAINQARKNKRAHSSTSSGLDVDHPFNRVAGHGRLGGNHRANG